MIDAAFSRCVWSYFSDGPVAQELIDHPITLRAVVPRAKIFVRALAALCAEAHVRLKIFEHG
jgi:hypothetical protein